MDEKPPILLQITSDPCNLRIVRAALESASAVMGLGKREAVELVLAVDEALTNVIRHGYKDEPDQPISLRIEQIEHDGRSGVAVVIEDECRGVDIAKIKGRPLEDIRPGGLGVHIIQRTMDHVDFSERENGAGIRLTMHKFAETPSDFEKVTQP